MPGLRWDPFRTRVFWTSAGLVGGAAGSFFAWELGLLSPPLPLLPRPEITTAETVFAGALAVLLALNAGLFSWQKRFGSCPIAPRRASGAAGVVGAAALLCPICLLVPFTIFGLSISLTFLSPFIPLLRVISLLLLLVSMIVLWPKKLR